MQDQAAAPARPALADCGVDGLVCEARDRRAADAGRLASAYRVWTGRMMPARGVSARGAGGSRRARGRRASTASAGEIRRSSPPTLTTRPKRCGRAFSPMTFAGHFARCDA